MLRDLDTATRRCFLASLAGAAASAQQAPPGKNFASDSKRYLDPATEFTVVRLTDPVYTSHLTAWYNRGMPGRNTLLFSCTRTGGLGIFRLDVRNGQMKEIAAPANLDPSTIALGAGDRTITYFDGPSLRQVPLSGSNGREVYRVPDGVVRGQGCSASPDGARLFWVEKHRERWHLRGLGILRNAQMTLVESEDELRHPIARPGQSTVLYKRGESWWLVGYDGRGAAQLKLAPGEALEPRWSPDGKTLLYISVPAEKGQLNTLREFSPETGTDKLIAKTTQFASFGANGDATVFVGASGSKASPHVLLLLRSARREMTICEHRSTDPVMTNPIFAPNSQRVLFESDQHGKPAIYTMTVDKFVEETDA